MQGLCAACGLQVVMPDGTMVQLRVGIHTGPCVSGLVGLGVPKWSIWGDAGGWATPQINWPSLCHGLLGTHACV